MTKSYKANPLRVDRYDNRHTLLRFKYIIISLQIVKRTFYLLNAFRTNVRVNFGCFTTTMS